MSGQARRDIGDADVAPTAPLQSAIDAIKKYIRLFSNRFLAYSVRTRLSREYNPLPKGPHTHGHSRSDHRQPRQSGHDHSFRPRRAPHGGCIKPSFGVSVLQVTLLARTVLGVECRADRPSTVAWSIAHGATRNVVHPTSLPVSFSFGNPHL